MSRMLEALRRIEAQRPQRRPAVETSPVESAAEKTLDRLEAAVELAAEPDMAGSVATLSPAPAQILPELDIEPAPVEDWPDDWAADPAPDPWDSGEEWSEMAPLPLRQELTSQGPSQGTQAPTSGNPTGPYVDLAERIAGQLLSDRPAALLFTAPRDGDRSPELLARLAPVLAERVGGEVLVVDANLRTSELDRQFNLEPAGSIGDVWSGSAPWSDAVRPTVMPSVSVLVAGSDGMFAGDYRDSAAGAMTEEAIAAIDWGRVLREMVQHYRLVLVDAASLTYPEAAKIACCCEGTYLAVRLGQVTSRTLRQATQAIERRRGRLLGCIVVE